MIMMILIVNVIVIMRIVAMMMITLLSGNENGSVKGRDCGSGIAKTTDLLRSSFIFPLFNPL